MWYGTHAQANNQLAPRACASSSRGTASHSSTPFDGPRTHIFACASQPPFLPPQHGCLPKGHGPAARALERDASLRHSSPPPTVAPNDARSPSLVAHSHGAAAHRSSLFSRAHPKRAHEGNTHRCSMFSPCEYVAISHVRCHRTAAAAAAAANPPPCSSRATAGAIPPGQRIARHRQPPASQHTHQ